MAGPIENTYVAAVTRAPRPGKKYFSLAEANRSLVYVARIVNDLAEAYQKVVEYRRLIENGSSEIREEVEADYELVMDDLSGYVDELHHVGVELKDFEKGLLDFPAIHRGREVYLCWHKGEKAICAWHEVDSGFSGRQNVALLKE